MRRVLRTAVQAALGLGFNAGAAAAILFGAIAAVEFSSPDVLDYGPTPGNARRTLNALISEAERFREAGSERTALWRELIAREMNEGDVAAARGFVLLAPHLAAPADATRARRLPPANASDEEAAAAIATLLEPASLRERVRALPARTSAAPSDDAAGRETAELLFRWASGEPVDDIAVVLSASVAPGVAPGGAPGNAGARAAAEEIASARLGAAVVRIARYGGMMSPVFFTQFEQAARTAIPPPRLKAALEARQGDPAVAESPEVAAVMAIRETTDEAALRRLRGQLVMLGAMARDASPAGAAQLLRQADSLRDLERLRLLAAAGGERTVAIAKRTPERLVLRAARGSIRWTSRRVTSLAVGAGGAAVMAVSVWFAVAGALSSAWRADAPGKARRSKASAVAASRAGKGG